MAGPLNDAAPRWIDIGLLPLINLLQAFIVAGIIFALTGIDPFRAIALMAVGAFQDDVAIGYTIFYATDFIFTGLAVAVAFHAGLFNIGAEGQATIAGLGITLVTLALDKSVPGIMMLPIALAASAFFGALWAFVPAYLQAYRGSHVVITTIMFNFLASALVVYMASHVLLPLGEMEPGSREFEPSATLPFIHDVAHAFGLPMATTPLNLSILWALICAGLVWLFLWRTRAGYALRVTGLAPHAALYAGISPKKVILLAMALSGALAGGAAFNQLTGYHHRLLLEFVAGAGFTGIAVSLMGRNHPLGIILASLLFGALYQGGAELAFEMPAVTREMIVAIQGLIILFSGALASMNRPWVLKLYFMTRALFLARNGVMKGA